MTRKGERSGDRTVLAAARRLARSDDSGATLILALVFITVVSIVTASILSFVDTSMRTTIAVRSEASQAAAAEGAAQIAINTIRTGTYAGLSGTHCFGASDNQNLSNFYTGDDGTKYSATVVCQQDGTDSQAGGGYFGGKPAYSLLALGNQIGDGITLSRGAFTSNGFTLNGDVQSNWTINVSPSLTTTGNVTATRLCSPNITAASVNCRTGVTVADPNYAVPTSPAPTPRNVPNCNPLKGSFQKFTFSPGVYRDVDGLNGLTGPLSLCTSPILYFTPGVYYFDFPLLRNTWRVRDGYVVGGTAVQTLDRNIAMPGTCLSPIPPTNPVGWTAPAEGQGVTFVFGAQSQIDVTDGPLTGGGHVELCGSYSPTAPPIAITALKNDITDTQGKTVHAGCDGCDVVDTESLGSGEIVIQGTTYIPKGRVNVAVLWNNGQRFNAGVVARSFSVQAVFSSGGNIGPVSALPGPGLPGRTVVYLGVFVCTGAGPCGVAGKNQLGVKVGIGDPNGGPIQAKRQVTVYNWSVQRT